MLPGPFHCGACLYYPSEYTCFTLWARSKQRRKDQRPASRCFGHISVVYMNAKGTYIKYYKLWKIYVLNQNILMSLLKYISAFGDNFQNLPTISQQFCKPLKRWEDVAPVCIFPFFKILPHIHYQQHSPCRYVSEELFLAYHVHAMDSALQYQLHQSLPHPSIHPSIHFLYPLNPSVGSRGGWSLSPYHTRLKNNKT